MGSSVGTMNWRPGAMPHCRHLSGRASLLNQIRTLFNSDASNGPPWHDKEQITFQRGGRRGSPCRAELRDEFCIRRRELEIVKLFRLYPAQISHFERLRLAFKNCAIEEVQADGLGGIVVVDAEEIVFHADFYSE